MLRKTTQYEKHSINSLEYSEKYHQYEKHSINSLQYLERNHPMRKTTGSIACKILRETTQCEKTLDQQLAIS
jgi:hypothetical protein